jgi:hypothetical protein
MTTNICEKIPFANTSKKCWYDQESQVVYTTRSIPECAQELLDLIRDSHYGGESENIFVVSKEDAMNRISLNEDTFELLMESLEYNGFIKVLGGGESIYKEFCFLCSVPFLPQPNEEEVDDGLSMLVKSFKN